MSTRLRALPLFAVAAALAACGEIPTLPTPIAAVGGASFLQSGSITYILEASGTNLPSDLAASVAAAGGTLTAEYGEAGVAIATSDSPGFAAKASKIKGIGGAYADVVVTRAEPTVGDLEVSDLDVEAAVHPEGVFGSTESFRLAQWAPDAIDAPAAWDAGARGRGARVAILDGGIASGHLDIAPNLDVAASRSFYPGQPYNFDTGTFWHGTHVAGIVAAAANNRGTVGIAPEATIIGVKVLHGPGGPFSAILNGIIYASLSQAEGGAGADIINMSLGADALRTGGNAALLSIITRVVNFARQRGVLVVAAAGNDGIDLDHSANLIFTPAQTGTGLSVSATGPVDFAHGASNYDKPASYTNFGQKAIELAGPGGDFILPGNAICSIPRIGPGLPLVAPCWVFDMVLAPSFGAGSYSWAAGTSMAAPAVSGVAALVVGKFGRMDPAHLATRLRQSADDLGKPGNDDFYGKGRINAFRAIQ